MRLQERARVLKGRGQGGLVSTSDWLSVLLGVAQAGFSAKRCEFLGLK